MAQKQIESALIRRTKVLLKTSTYKEIAALLSKEGYKTPRNKKPTKHFVNYIVSKYIH